MGRVIKNLAITQFILEAIKTASPKAMGAISGRMERPTKGSGPMDLSMDREFGEDPKGTLTSENGEKERRMDMECIHGSTETDMRESSKIVSNMEKEFSILPMEIPIRETTKKESPADMDNIIGLEVVFLKENLRKD